MANMPQEGQQMQPEQAQGQSPKGGSAMQLAQRINNDLMELASIFEGAGAPEQVLNALAGVIKGYQQTVTQAVEGAEQKQPQDQMTTTPEQGSANVQQAM